MNFEPIRYRIWKNKKMQRHQVERGGVHLYWTRAYDATGQFIFEGDVVRIHDVYRNMNKYILVKWEGSKMAWNLGKFKKQGTIFHVVGNIYQDQGLSKLL